MSQLNNDELTKKRSTIGNFNAHMRWNVVIHIARVYWKSINDDYLPFFYLFIFFFKQSDASAIINNLSYDRSLPSRKIRCVCLRVRLSCMNSWLDCAYFVHKHFVKYSLLVIMTMQEFKLASIQLSRDKYANIVMRSSTNIYETFWLIQIC